jgi:hypothetical protein
VEWGGACPPLSAQPLGRLHGYVGGPEVMAHYVSNFFVNSTSLNRDDKRRKLYFRKTQGWAEVSKVCAVNKTSKDQLDGGDNSFSHLLYNSSGM